MFRLHIDGEEVVAAKLSRAAFGVQVKASAAIGVTAARVENTQKQNVQRRSEALADSIVTTNGDGRSFAPGHLTAVVGPTDWKAHLVENGTQRAAPRPFVGTSLDPHRGDLIRAMGLIAGDI